MQGDLLTTDNIAALITAIIGDGDWDAGGSNKNMVFVIYDDSGTADTGTRTVEARNSDPAILQITTQVCATANAADVDTGLRFQIVKVPQGQNITSARIDFTASASDGGTPAYTIKIEDVDNAAAFNATDIDNISTRTYAANTVAWTPGHSIALTRHRIWPT